MTAVSFKTNYLTSPLDIAESIMIDRDWVFDRLDEEQILAEHTGNWCTYKLWVTWREEEGGLTLSCAVDGRVAKPLVTKMYSLLCLANEKMWLGHFELDQELQSVVYRYSLHIHHLSTSTEEQMQELLDIAIQECERFYPAFQGVLWGGKSPKDALEYALFETIAEA